MINRTDRDRRGNIYMNLSTFIILVVLAVIIGAVIRLSLIHI